MAAVYGPQSFGDDIPLSHLQYLVKTVQNGRTLGPAYPLKSLEYPGIPSNTVQCSFTFMEDEVWPVVVRTPIMY